jgi:hypothetical protein
VALPPVVDGVPLARLAAHALAEARAWSDGHPTSVRVVRASIAGLEQISGYHRTYGSSVPSYVIALDGHFYCAPPRCEASVPAGPPPPIEPTDPTTVPLSFMTFTIPVTGPADGSLSVGRIDPDLAKLGHVYDLQPYVLAAE